MAKGLHGPIEAIAGADELSRLEQEAAQELQDPGRWGVNVHALPNLGHQQRLILATNVKCEAN